MIEAYDIMKNIAGQHQKDAVQLYTDLLGSKLRNLNEKTREVLMHDIINLVFQAKINNLNIQSFQSISTHLNHPTSTFPALSIYNVLSLYPRFKPHYQVSTSREHLFYQSIQSTPTISEQQTSQVHYQNISTMSSQSSFHEPVSLVSNSNNSVKSPTDSLDNITVISSKNYIV